MDIYTTLFFQLSTYIIYPLGSEHIVFISDRIFWAKNIMDKWLD